MKLIVIICKFVCLYEIGILFVDYAMRKEFIPVIMLDITDFSWVRMGARGHHIIERDGFKKCCRHCRF